MSRVISVARVTRVTKVTKVTRVTRVTRQGDPTTAYILKDPLSEALTCRASVKDFPSPWPAKRRYFILVRIIMVISKDDIKG